MKPSNDLTMIVAGLLVYVGLIASIVLADYSAVERCEAAGGRLVRSGYGSECMKVQVLK